MRDKVLLRRILIGLVASVLWSTISILVAFIIAITWALTMPAHSQEHRHPNETITGATGKFYETWRRPDMPSVSCCNLSDCYATPSRMRSGRVQAVHRESGDWIDIPPEKIELNRDSPDGLSHLCAASYKFVFCFVMGGGT